MSIDTNAGSNLKRGVPIIPDQLVRQLSAGWTGAKATLDVALHHRRLRGLDKRAAQAKQDGWTAAAAGHKRSAFCHLVRGCAYAGAHVAGQLNTPVRWALGAGWQDRPVYGKGRSPELNGAVALGLLACGAWALAGCAVGLLVNFCTEGLDGVQRAGRAFAEFDGTQVARPIKLGLGLGVGVGVATAAAIVYLGGVASLASQVALNAAGAVCGATLGVLVGLAAVVSVQAPDEVRL